MSHGVRYFDWRNGRPIWKPTKALRAAGYSAVLLRDDERNWLSLPAALHAAAEINAGLPRGVNRQTYREAATVKEHRRKLKERFDPEPGFVYFCKMGEHVKIGFSARPMRRLVEIATDVPGELRGFVFVPGTRADEAQLHEHFAAFHARREWFRMTPAIAAVMARSITFGRVMLDAERKADQVGADDVNKPATEADHAPTVNKTERVVSCSVA